jgi:hypothetical protein
MSESRRGLLVSGLDRASIPVDEFDDWCDTEEIPRQKLAGKLAACERWIGADGPGVSIVTCELDSLPAAGSTEYQAIAAANQSPWAQRIARKCRRICYFEAEQITPGNEASPQGAGGLMMFAMNVAPEAEADFNDWYDQEHVPSLASVPGCLRARRFRILKALSEGRQRYLAVYHLESPDVCSSVPWKAAIETPWTHKIRPFQRDRLRIVLRRYAR